jgi:hypothetical protein
VIGSVQHLLQISVSFFKNSMDYKEGIWVHLPKMKMNLGLSANDEVFH